LLLNVGFFALVFLGVTTFQSRNMLATDNHAAPALSGITLDGDFYDLATIEAKPALIYFFAPWCKVCSVSADNLVRLRRWRDDADLEIVAIALDWSSIDEVRSYAERHSLNMPVVLADPKIAQQWRIYAFPSYYVLDSEQRVARNDIGYSSQLGLWWRTWLVE
jgi:peroxiredoxin